MSGASNDWVGQTLSDGRYRVDAKLGEGGMGFVYKVWDRNLDTDLVVKAPRKAMLDDPEFARRFALEIRSLVKLSHPNIVKVTDVGEHEGLPFAVMQYLSGGTLDERQEYGRDGRPLPASTTSMAGWVSGMAAALDFIHGKDYIHRDVKPGNILFDEHGHPYLSDFGVAKVLSEVEASAKQKPSMTGIGIVLGTPEYMAPELIMGAKFDGRVDQYALAATAYEILCGRKPFSGETATAILVRQTTEAPPPMVELPEVGSEAISRVIMKGLAKKPADRYKTCVEFATALVAALAKAGPARARVAAPVGGLNCPSCGVGFTIPTDLEKFKGRKSKCKSCFAPFRFADDGLSISRIDLDAPASPSGSVEFSPAQPPNRTVQLNAMPNPARANATMKLDAMPAPAPVSNRANATMKMEAMPSPPRANATMKMEAVPASPRANATMKMEAMPAPGAPIELGESSKLFDNPEPGRFPVAWVAGGVGAVAAAILGLFLAFRPSNQGTILITFAPTVADATFKIDGETIDLQKLDAPMTLSVKDHILEARGEGLVPFQSNLAIKPGINPTFEVKLARVPKPKPVDVVSEPIDSPGSRVSSNKIDVASPPAPAPVDPGSSRIHAEKIPAELAEKPEADVEKHDPEPGRFASKKTGLKPMTLKEIIANPEDHLGTVISPSDLLMIHTKLNPRPFPEKGLTVKSRDGSIQEFQKLGTPFEVVLNHELVVQLRDQVDNKVLLEADYPAVVQMKIIKNPGGIGYLGVVELMEFLYYVDPRFIAGQNNEFHKVFFVVHAAPNGAFHGLTKNYAQWKSRVKGHDLSTIVNLYQKNGRDPMYSNWAMVASKNPSALSREFHEFVKHRIH